MERISSSADFQFNAKEPTIYMKYKQVCILATLVTTGPEFQSYAIWNVPLVSWYGIQSFGDYGNLLHNL